jgi:hypothetical protein
VSSGLGGSKRDSGLSLKHVALLKSHMEDMSTSLLAQGVLHIAAARLEHLEKFRSSWDMTGEPITEPVKSCILCGL